MGKSCEACTIFNRLKTSAIAVALLMSALPLLSADPATQVKKWPWMDKTLSPDKRAALVLKQMTLDEKIQLVHGLPTWSLPGTPGYRRTPGSLEGDGFVPDIPRLGLPALQIICAGVGATDIWRRWNGQSTMLPSSLAETATWDTKAAYEF